MMQPTLAGFSSFIYNIMGISPLVLPTDSPVISWSFSVATMLVNPALAIVGSSFSVTPETNLYVEAVYNLAADNLINYAQDQPGRTYFTDLRASLKINNFAAGVVQSASDQGTSDSLAVPDSLKNLTLSNLQNLKTPWGRAYLAMAQTYGTMWGVA
jgi:hypothetical protein